jgi:hypothetical protein
MLLRTKRDVLTHVESYINNDKYNVSYSVEIL